MGRVNLEEHGGHRILVIDCRNCTPKELIDVIEEVEAIVTAQPEHSISTLTDFTGAEFDRDSITRMKEVAAFARPHIIRAAFIGVESLPEVYHKAIENFSARRFETFDTKEEALAYLVRGESSRQSA